MTAPVGGGDVKAPLDFAHDVGYLRLRLDGLPNLYLYRRRPWSFTTTFLWNLATSRVRFPATPRWGLITDPAIQLLYGLLYTPMIWSDYVNGYIYQFVVFTLQAAQTHNITIDRGVEYNLPSGNITIDEIGNSSSPNLTSYSTAAAIGMDDPMTTIRQSLTCSKSS